jgi:hypothetical protein
MAKRRRASNGRSDDDERGQAVPPRGAAETHPPYENGQRTDEAAQNSNEELRGRVSRRRADPRQQ